MASVVQPFPIKPLSRESDRAVRSRWPVYELDEIADVVDVLRSGQVNALQHGERCRAFEAAFADRCAMPFALSLANGTLALELALRALEIGPGDEVIVTARSFVASASCVVNVGATPVFADVDPDSQNITADAITRVVTGRTRAVIVVHLAGWPCDMDEIMTVARRHDLFVVEDCAQCHGALYRQRPTGSFGDAAAFSFCSDKIISTGGEGGMLLLKDRAAWSRAWSYKDHGKDPEAMAGGAGNGLFRLVHASIGSNFRMTEMQAAIGLRQLEKLPGWVAARRQRATLLTAALDGLPGLRIPQPPSQVSHAYYKYYAFIAPRQLARGWSRDRIVIEARRRGVPVFTGSCPEIYREGAFGGVTATASRLPVARRLGECSLMMPVDHTLDEGEVRMMGLVLGSVIEEAACSGWAPTAA